MPFTAQGFTMLTKRFSKRPSRGWHAGIEQRNRHVDGVERAPAPRVLRHVFAYRHHAVGLPQASCETR